MQTTNQQATPLTYMRQLDGLRCIAVMLVLFQHYLPWELVYKIAWGRLGVRLFFVLSGFLITKILLDCRDAAHAGAVTPWRAARQFYTRRFLRIFPIYYITIALTLLLGYSFTQRDFWWHLAYLSNVKYSFIGGFDPGNRTAHFWSLAVEEQFYLIWPWIILFTPRKALLPIVILTVLTGPLYRAAGVWLDWPSVSLRLFTPACMDTLGIGALLAILERASRGNDAPLRSLTVACAVIGFPSLIYLYGYSPMEPLFTVCADSAAALFFVWCVYGAAKCFKGPLGLLLSLPPVVYIGRISYGIYVIHLFVPWLYHYFRHEVPLGLPALATYSPYTVAAVYTLITILFASISWFAYEKPLNDLKSRFPYVLKRTPDAQCNPVAASVSADAQP